MNKKVAMAVMLSLALVYLGGCKKEEKQPVPKTSAMPQGMGLSQEQSSPQGHQMMSGGKLQVVVPANVKGKWSSVKLVVEDKEAKKTQEYEVKLNSEWKIPGSALKVTVGDFLPDFIMDGTKITSGSGELNNPAVGIKITDGDKQIFPEPGKQWGWLWSRKELQSAHPFEHPRFSIMLKEPVKK